jgi:hypothetical protein
MKVSQKQVDEVTALEGSKRYDHFVKMIVDREQVWALYNDGWAVASTDDGEQVFPLWPAREYALLCADDEWSAYEPKAISLNEFVDELLPHLEREGLLPGIFITPNDNGVPPSVEQLRDDVAEELKRY